MPVEAWPAGGVKKLLLIDRPGTGAGRGEIEKHETIKDRGRAAIDDRIEAVRRGRDDGPMSQEIGDRHLAGADEGGIAAEKADADQRAAHQFDHARPAFESIEGDD